MNLRLTKSILVAMTPAVFILFTACGGGKDAALANQPAPAVVSLNCPNGAPPAPAGQAGIYSGADQLAQIPDQLPNVAPAPKTISIHRTEPIYLPNLNL